MPISVTLSVSHGLQTSQGYYQVPQQPYVVQPPPQLQPQQQQQQQAYVQIPPSYQQPQAYGQMQVISCLILCISLMSYSMFPPECMYPTPMTLLTSLV